MVLRLKKAQNTSIFRNYPREKLVYTRPFLHSCNMKLFFLFFLFAPGKPGGSTYMDVDEAGEGGANGAAAGAAGAATGEATEIKTEKETDGDDNVTEQTHHIIVPSYRYECCAFYLQYIIFKRLFSIYWHIFKHFPVNLIFCSSGTIYTSIKALFHYFSTYVQKSFVCRLKSRFFLSGTAAEF